MQNRFVVGGALLALAVVGPGPAQAQQWFESAPAWSHQGGGGVPFLGSVGTGGDLNGDGFHDVVVGRPGGSGQPGELLYFQTDPGTFLPPGAPTAVFVGTGGSQLGMVLGSPGSVGGDATDDLILGLPYYSDGASNTGGTWFLEGSSAVGTYPLDVVASRAAGFANVREGYDLAVGGDIDGDGCGDWVVGMPGQERFAVGYGCRPEWDYNYEVHQGAGTPGQHGESVATGLSLDNDDRSDVLVSGDGEIIEVYLNQGFGTATAPTPWATWQAVSFSAVGSGFGDALAVGDYDGDGYGDVAIGGPQYSYITSNRGAVWICWGGPFGPQLTQCTQARTGTQVAELLGSELVTLPDADGDGDDELLVSAPGWSGTINREGRVVLLAGGSRASFGSAIAWQAHGGQAAVPGFGQRNALASAGDVNGDNLGDLLIGSPLWDLSSGNNEGKVELYLAVPTNDACVEAIDLTVGETHSSGTRTATVDAGAAAAGVCGSNTGLTEYRGTWYRFQGDGSTLRLSLCGTASFDSQITVYTGGCTQLACYSGNDDVVADCAANSSRLDMPTVSGEWYWALVHGYDTANGAYTLSLEPAPATADSDNDGVPDSADCAPLDGSVFPGATESCDGVDNDCDGTLPADEADDDVDGLPACADCDDADPSVGYGFPEACDGLDNDCDGLVPTDELDVDTDGWSRCEGDCDDGQASVNPGLDELCGDGVDNNCDGSIDEPVDVDLDGYEGCAEDCDDGDPDVNPGRVEDGPLCTNGVDDDCDGDVDLDDPDCVLADDDDTGPDDDDTGPDDDDTGPDDDDSGPDDDDSVDDDDTAPDDDDASDDDDSGPAGSEEGACEDGVDNDGDGFTDGDDPECWSRGIFGCSTAGRSGAGGFLALALIGLLGRRRSRWLAVLPVLAVVASWAPAPASAGGVDEWRRQVAFAELEIREGNYDRARRAADSALLLAPENTDALFVKALSLDALGEHEEAASVLAAYFAAVTPLGLHPEAAALKDRVAAAVAGGPAAVAEGEAAPTGDAEATSGSSEVPEAGSAEADEAAARAARDAARTARVQSADYDESKLTVRLFDAPDFLPLPSGGAVMATPGERVLRIEGEHGRVDLPVSVAGGRGRRPGASVSPAALAPASLLVAGLPAGAVVSISQQGPGGIVIEELYATSNRYVDVHPSGIPVVPPQTIDNLVGAPATVSARHHKWGSSDQQTTLTAGGVTRITFDPYSFPKQPDAALAAETIRAAEDAKLAARQAEVAAQEALVGPAPQEKPQKAAPPPVVQILPTIVLAGASAAVSGVLMGAAADQSAQAATHRADAEAAAHRGDVDAVSQSQALHDAARQAETGLFAGSLAAAGTAVAGIVVTIVIDQKRKK